MRVAFVASEVHPFSKTGGLADVAGALPKALSGEGVEAITITPLHGSARKHGLDRTPMILKVPLGSGTIETRVWRKGDVYFLEHGPFFDRPELYSGPWGDHGDNAPRFTFLCRGAIELVRRFGGVDVLHAHDWQAGLVPVYARTLYAEEFERARSAFTIHNLAYQGQFWHLDVPLTGLDWGLFNWRQLEFHGKLNFMKAGLVFSDAVTTVSPTYSREIRTPEHGYGLDPVLRGRGSAVTGILNGVDYDEWNPEKDPHLPARYSVDDLSGKAACKAELQKRCGLPVRPDVPVVGLVSRLAEQKGIDLILGGLDALLAENAQYVVLGSGESRFEDGLRHAAGRRRDRLSVQLKFDNGLAHLIEAGSDVFLMPSRYEPCGLNQIYSLRYGTPPVVRSTGGLADTVLDGVTGFVFGPYTVEDMLETVRRALRTWKDKETWRRIVTAGMRQDFSWTASAKQYVALYDRLLKEPPSIPLQRLPPTVPVD